MGRKILKPLGDMVTVKRMETSNKIGESQLIEAPDTAKEKSNRGFVLMTGPGRLLESGTRAQPQVKEGDEVIFASFAGSGDSVVKLDGQEYTLMREDDILAMIVDADAE